MPKETCPTPRRRGRPRKVPGRSELALRQAQELKESGYDRAAEMLRSHGGFSVKGCRERLDRALEFCKMAPVIEIVKIAKDENIPAELRLRALTWLGNKMLPDLKSVDMQVEEKRDVQIVVKSFAGAVNAADLAKPVLAHEVMKVIGE